MNHSKIVAIILREICQRADQRMVDNLLQNLKEGNHNNMQKGHILVHTLEEI